MAGIVSRIFGSFDRVPAPLACGMTLVMGCAEAIALFNGNVPTSAPWYVRLAPFAAFAIIAGLSVFIIVSSRPAVVHRETGPLGERVLLYFQHAGRIATLHALLATVVVVPAVLVTGRFDETTQSPTAVAPAKPIELPIVGDPVPQASSAPSASAASVTEDKPVPSATVTASTPPTPPPSAASPNKAKVKAAGASLRAPPSKAPDIPPAPAPVTTDTSESTAMSGSSPPPGPSTTTTTKTTTKTKTKTR